MNMRSVLVVPISPRHAGNGLAHRARFWQRVLAELGDLTTLVVPVAGPFLPGGDEVEVSPGADRDTTAVMPYRARQAPRALGAAWGSKLEAFDVVVGLRSYLGPFCLGLRDTSTARVVIDLDDDDATFYASIGQHDEAALFAALVTQMRAQADEVVAAHSFDGITEIPNSVDLGPPHPDQQREPLMVMVGNFGYDPNVVGARWFIDNVVPVVHAAVPDARVVIAGPGSEQFAPFGRGFVDDIEALYQLVSVAVVPVLAGSGTRIKALEAWAHGVPVVGTTVGLSGLAFEDNLHALVADDPAAFAEAIVQVLTDNSLERRLGDAGRHLVENRYSSAQVGAAAQQLITTVLARPTSSRFSHSPHLAVTETHDGLVVVEPVHGRAHHLNSTAAIVFALADGAASDEEMSSSVQQLFSLSEPPRAAVAEAISRLCAEGLLVSNGL